MNQRVFAAASFLSLVLTTAVMGGCCWFKHCGGDTRPVDIGLAFSASDDLNRDADGVSHPVWVYVGFYADTVSFMHATSAEIRDSAVVKKPVPPEGETEVKLALMPTQMRQTGAIIGVLANFGEDAGGGGDGRVYIPVRDCKGKRSYSFVWHLAGHSIKPDWAATEERHKK